MPSVMMQGDEVLDLLRETGALHAGHFRGPDGRHSPLYFQMSSAHAMYNHWRRLCVGLSRVLRTAKEVVPLLPHATIVCPSSGGIAVSFGVRDVLPADQLYWTERDADGKGLHFRQFASIQPGERCILIDDIILSGSTLRRLVDVVHKAGGHIVAIGVIVDTRMEEGDFDGIPFYSLLRVPIRQYPDGKDCPQCVEGLPVVEVNY